MKRYLRLEDGVVTDLILTVTQAAPPPGYIETQRGDVSVGMAYIDEATPPKALPPVEREAIRLCVKALKELQTAGIHSFSQGLKDQFNEIKEDW